MFKRILKTTLLRKSADLLYLGSESFVKEVLRFLPKKHCIDDIPMHKELLPTPTISQIQEEVTDFFRVGPEELSISRPKKINLPQTIAIYLSVKLTQKTYTEISSKMGNISPSAISQTYHTIQKKLISDKSLANTVVALEQRICLRFQT